jgi:hypothetical protein
MISHWQRLMTVSNVIIQGCEGNATTPVPCRLLYPVPCRLLCYSYMLLPLNLSKYQKARLEVPAGA